MVSDTSGPPVVIHGGSFHVLVAADSTPFDLKDFKVPTSDYTQVSFGSGYDRQTITGLPSGSSILICDSVAGNSCSGDGIQVKLASSGSANEGTIEVIVLNNNTLVDTQDELDSPRQFGGQLKYRLKQGTPIYPSTVIVTPFDGQSVTKTCGKGDYESCWVSFGAGWK